MREFIVKVDGRSYRVEVEEVGTAGGGVKAPKEASAVKVPAAKAADRPKAAAGSIYAPLPGTILQVNVNPGDNVKRGEVLLVLEAMKMQNEIISPADGTITAVNVAVGQQVDKDLPLVVIE